MSDLRERVAEELWQADSMRVTGMRRSVPWSEAGPAAHQQWKPLADAAIALCMEEAAKVAETCHVGWPMDGREQRNVCAAAIRALGKP